MWYLIVPPIIVVLAIVLLLWYLSKKSDDPSVQKRVLSLDGVPKKKRFQSFHEWRLRSLEKFVQRSKNSSLKIHNAFHTWLQSIRTRRQNENKREYRVADTDSGIVFSSDTKNETESRGAEVVQDETFQSTESRFSIPLIRRKKRVEHSLEEESSSHEVKISEEEREEKVERPMVSEKVAVPEQKRKQGSPEEDLIARIATNPKDFEAYEALGDFYMENGNVKDAKECYRQVLKLSPVHRMVKIKIRRLEKLLSQKGG